MRDTRYGIWGVKPAVLRLFLLVAILRPCAAPAVTTPDQMQFADGLFARGLYDLAVQEYLAAATNAAATNAGTAWFRAGESYRQLGRRTEAAACFRRSAEEYPNEPQAGRASFRYAEISVTGGEYVEAVNRFRALVDSRPAPDILAPALYYLGYAQAKMNLAAEAEQVLRRLVKEFPDSPYAVLGRVDLAALLGAGPGHDEEIRVLLREAAERGRGSAAGAQALLQLGDRAFRARDYTASADAYGRLLQDYAKDARARESRLPAAWALFRAGRAAEALPVIEQGMAEAPSAAVAEWLYLQANSLRLLERATEAQAVYDRLLKEHPQATWVQPALYETAVMAFKAKDAERALALASQVQPTADLAADVLWLRAEAARELGRRPEAIEAYDRLAREFPASDRAAAARFQAARQVQEQDRMAEAAQRYRAMAKDHPRDDLAGDALFAAAYCRVVLKDYAGALEDWQALRRRGPYARMDEALYGMAQAQIELQREDEARVTLESLLKEHPRSRLAAEAHYLMGSLLEKAEKWDVAEYHYRMATLKKPEPALVRKIEFRRVAVLQRQGQHDQAGAVLNGLLEGGAGDEVPPSLLDWLVRWNVAQERHVEAERAALALAGQKDKPAWRQIGWYFAGRSRQALGRADEARAAYRQSMEVEASTREGVEAAFFLGQVASAAGDWPAARDAWSKSAERAGTEDMADIRARSYFGLGQAAAAQEQWDEAARAYLGVAVLYDDVTLAPEALYRAAEAFGKLGRAGDREKTLAELRQRYPDSTWNTRAAP